jgi:WD40 repeat protein
MATGKRVGTMIDPSGKPYSGGIAFSLDGKWLAAGGGGPGEVRVWDTATGKLLSTLEGRITGGIESIALSPDGKWLAAGGDDDTARLWHSE